MCAMLKRIVATTDGSDRAERAVTFAASLAEKFGADLTLLHIRIGDAHVPEADIRRHAERARAKLAVVHDERPAEAICRFADEQDADAIVVGNYGMSERKTFLLGNVPNRVSHNAQCTVIIVDTRDSKERKRHRRGG
jgi:nucleotide-binding universal stress UspA family protein